MKTKHLVSPLFHSWEHLIYQLGGHSEVISTVIFKGDVVHQKEKQH